MTNTWTNRGCVFRCRVTGRALSYAQCPTPFNLGAGLYRVFFCTRDGLNRSQPFSVDICLRGTPEVGCVSEQPLLDLGGQGTFDEQGVMPSCIVEERGNLWMYYTGWNTGTSVPYRNSIGVAVSCDKGKRFQRL